MKLSFCVACGEADQERLEHHHLVPRSKGGADDEANLITLCHVCHGRAHGFARVNIKKLTPQGLSVAKARGVVLGNPHIEAAQAKGAITIKANAERFASNILPLILPLKAQGMSMRQIAGELNARGVETARGGKWQATQISDILKRAS